MKCLNCRNFVTAYAFLTGWHLFTFFTVAPFLCIEAVVQKCSVKRCSQNTSGGCCYVYFIGHTGFLLHLSGFQHCNLGEFFLAHTGSDQKSRILFSMLQYSPEKLSKLQHENSCFAFRKKFSGFIFFLILFSFNTQLFKNQLTQTQDA